MSTLNLPDPKIDPEGFEQAKKQLIEQFINSLPPERQQQARQQQWLIDGKLRKYKNPLVRAQVAYNMMIESFQKLNESLSPFRKS